MARSPYPFVALSLFSASVALAGACSSKSEPAPLAPAAPSGTTSAPPPFQASPAEVYVAKVKNLLVGSAPTDAEIAAVKADPAALGGLIDGWMATPEYEKKMLGFFATAFQQSQVVSGDFATQMSGVQGQLGNNAAITSRLLFSLRASYALTVWQLIKEGKPFSETMTTQRFMMTPPLMALYAFLDEHHVDDGSKIKDRITAANPAFQFSVSAAQGPIPLAETLDPKSPNYMHWYLPDLGKYQMGACAADPRVYKQPASLYQILMGGLDPIYPADGTKCQGSATTSKTGQFDEADFSAWKMVTVRPPQANENVTAFYDLPTLKSASELVLTIPRVGFFTTPSFLAQWNTNLSNSARVTINQTLVVALGRIFDGSHPTVPPSEAALDPVHAAPPECVTCHRTLDPMRQYFRQAFTVNFHEQTDAKQTALPGVFAFEGVTSQIGGMVDLGAQLAQHPDFPVAWAQKLCYYANSSACAEDDPEFVRIVEDFKASSLSWNTLVRDVLSSPITTGASATKTADGNAQTGAALVPISRREHWCNALSIRLGLPDACQLASIAKGGSPQQVIQSIALDLSSDGYGRGSPVPVLASDPNLFFRGSVENLCRLVADEVVDAPGGASKYTSADPNAAIADFVANVMALTSGDPRAAGARAILDSHFQGAQQQGVSPANALKSTFVLACISPSSVGLGL